MGAALSCPRCGASVQAGAKRCSAGHEVDSEHLLAVMSTFDLGSHEVAPRRATANDDNLVGRRFGRFVIEGLLGRGGMGAVFRARHEELGHFAAIKILDRRLVGSRDLIGPLFREARAAAQIGHVNIVQVFDFGRDPDVGGYIVMELLHGGASLDDVIERDRVLEEPRIRAIGLEMCDALAAAHAKGIVHRDLKPSNVYLQKTASGELVKVMDFGIAKVAESLVESATQSGTILGTPRYMSPEQWCSEPVDARSDVYSFGVMLYQMATGAFPFPNAQALPQLAAAVMQPIAPRPREVRPQISEGLEAIILRCCRPSKDERYASMREVADDLRALGGGAAIGPPRGTRRRMLAGAGVALGVVIGLTMVLALRTTKAHEDARATPPPPAAPTTSEAVPIAPTSEPAPIALASMAPTVSASSPVVVARPRPLSSPSRRDAGAPQHAGTKPASSTDDLLFAK